MLRFEKINIEKDIETCVRFREDSYLASFPGSNEWKKYWDEGRYRDWIQEHAIKFPDGAIHIHCHSHIIGQLEFAYFKEIGHINLYYIVPTERGKGIGQLAHAFVQEQLLKHGCKTAQLRVSPTNLRATNFYKKLGWSDCGQDPTYGYVNLYKISL